MPPSSWSISKNSKQFVGSLYGTTTLKVCQLSQLLKRPLFPPKDFLQKKSSPRKLLLITASFTIFRRSSTKKVWKLPIAHRLVTTNGCSGFSGCSASVAATAGFSSDFFIANKGPIQTENEAKKFAVAAAAWRAPWQTSSKNFFLYICPMAPCLCINIPKHMELVPYDVINRNAEEYNGTVFEYFENVSFQFLR